MPTCPECGKEITRLEALDGYCSMCGYRFPSKKQAAPTMSPPSCPECGKEITNQDQLNGYCSMCGAILPSKSSNPPPAPSSRDESFHGFNYNSSFHNTSDTQSQSFHGFNYNSSFHDTKSQTESQTDIYLSRISRDVSMILEYVKWIFGIIASIVALSVLGAIIWLIWFWSNL